MALLCCTGGGQHEGRGGVEGGSKVELGKKKRKYLSAIKNAFRFPSKNSRQVHKDDPPLQNTEEPPENENIPPLSEERQSQINEEERKLREDNMQRKQEEGNEGERKEEGEEREREESDGNIKDNIEAVGSSMGSDNIYVGGKNLSQKEEEERKNRMAWVAASVAAAEAATVAAKAAADVAQLATAAADAAQLSTAGDLSLYTSTFLKEEEEQAITTIQAGIRGRLARRELWILKGPTRFQGLIKGDSVQKQVAAALKWMQTLIQVQAQIRASRAETSEKIHPTQQKPKQRQQQQDNTGKAMLGWNYNKNVEEVEAKKSARSDQASLIRERTLAYAYYYKHWRYPPKHLSIVATQPSVSDETWVFEYQPGMPKLGWRWIDRWIVSKSRDTNTLDNNAETSTIATENIYSEPEMVTRPKLPTIPRLHGSPMRTENIYSEPEKVTLPKLPTPLPRLQVRKGSIDQTKFLNSPLAVKKRPSHVRSASVSGGKRTGISGTIFKDSSRPMSMESWNPSDPNHQQQQQLAIKNKLRY